MARTPGYFVSDPIREALNEIGLWHGRAEMPSNDKILDELQDDSYDRWNNPYLASFGGLYVAANKGLANSYAGESAQIINDHYGQTWAEPRLHQITLLPGIEVAIDEDEFGWADIALEAENHPAVYDSVEEYTTGPWDAAAMITHVRALALNGNLHIAIRKYIAEMVERVKPKGSDIYDFYDWTPEDMQDEMDELTRIFTEPLLGEWYQLYLTASAMTFLNLKTRLPHLRILNDQWVATPPMSGIGVYPNPKD